MTHYLLCHKVHYHIIGLNLQVILKLEVHKHHLRILLSMKILRPQITEVLSQWVEDGAQESRFLRSTRGDSTRGGPLQGACQ